MRKKEKKQKQRKVKLPEIKPKVKTPREKQILKKKELRKQEKLKKKQEKVRLKKEKKEKKLRKETEEKIKKVKAKEVSKTREQIEKRRVLILVGAVLGAVSVLILLLLDKRVGISFASFFVVAGLFFLYIHFQKKLKEMGRRKRIELVFPDFLQLMATNLRAGMTIDRAMMFSSRPEFTPLDQEILQTGKDIATGKSIETSLLDMAKRTKSEKIHKTILLIISGIRAGGNLATLLEETSINIRERTFVEKRAASNVLMYVIFIFVAAAVGAPLLFSLSSLLVETLINVLAGLPEVQAASSQSSLPFTLSSINISIDFIKYFSIVFIIVINILASLVLGLVSKGEEKEGIRYLIPMLVVSMITFFIVRVLLSRFVAGLFG